MAYKAKKTEHSGSKKGCGAYWGPKREAKRESSRTRRRAAQSQVMADAEPLFSKTGVGSLRSATPEERKQEEARSEALIERLKQRAAASSQKTTGT